VTRVFWDTMLFVYLLEGNKNYFKQVRLVLQRSYERGDELFTSCLAVGEVMAGGPNASPAAQSARKVIEEMGFTFLRFDENCMETFSKLRSVSKVKAPDAIHLACAAAAGVDLFLTGDKALLSRRPLVSGIQFIADFEHPPF
jgi:uncharacterized protein